MDEQQNKPRSELPEGTVTFLFTDIQGSTRLLHQLGEKYITLLADHHRILREIFAKWHGREVDTEGDAFFVSFPKATEAVAAVVEAQRAIDNHRWPGEASLRVRMGLHTGEPWTAQEGYVGMDVHRAARIAHTGHGGQVLLSETTTPLVRSGLPDGVTLLDLGRHRLKDIENPERIHQLVIDGLPSEFPALKTLGFVEPAELIEREPARLPAFLREATSHPRPIFVGREHEMSRLNDLLSKTLEGQGQVAFLAGDAGSGKSSLLSAFTAQAGGGQDAPLVAWGVCNAFSGRGDPYLPFRKVLSALTGDVEAEWAAGAVTTDEARAAWQAMPYAVEALLAKGPDLLNTLIQIPPIVERLEAAYPAGHPSLKQLKERAADKIPAGQIERSELFEQVTATLRRLSEHRPLIIVLDDLQWADRGSLDLLFHLGRGLAGARILLLIAYRPDEVTADKDHPLRPLLDEFRRLFGDVWLDLNKVPGRTFVDQFVDSEANHLDRRFRKTLFTRTGGHPLFMVELLRDMQERGDLVKDDSGAWIEGPSLDWDELPVRVEGAIEARIGRLEEELRDILTVGAVEGETFTAQVVARVQELQERQLLRTLSRELSKRHRLIHEDQTERIGRQLISHYRFVHNMFQRYLYNDLSEAERQILHGEVGQILETLYEAKSDEVVVQLARHFDAAGESEKAAGYLLAAGDRARTLYAHREAIEHYQRALKHLEILGDDERLARTWMRLGLTYHSAFNYRLSHRAYDEGFLIWQRIGRKRQEHRAKATLKLWLEQPRTLEPPFAGDINSEDWIRQLFSGLVQDTDQMVIVPDIARRWEIHDSGLTYVFHLRDDARWSDSHPVTSADFSLAWQRMLSPRTPGQLASLLFDIKGARAFRQGQLADENHLGLHTPDDHTLVVELERPASYLLHLLAGAFMSPVPGHLVKELGDEWVAPENIVSNGPYMIAGWSPERGVTLARNPHYHGGYGGNVNQVEVSLVDLLNSVEQPFDAYRRGDIDILDATFFPGNVFRSALRRYGEYYFKIPHPMTFGIAFNRLRPPLDDVRVRRALAMTIDQEQYVRTLQPDQASPALGGWIPEGLPGHSPDISLPHDPAAARRLMEEAGYPDGQGFPSLEMLWPESSTDREQAGYLASLWRVELGITVRPSYLPFLEWLEFMMHVNERPPIYYRPWAADFPDPDNFLVTGLEWERVSGMTILQEKIKAARSLTEQSGRLALYRQADKILIDEALIVPLTYKPLHFFVNPRVYYFPLTRRWQDVIIDTA